MHEQIKHERIVFDLTEWLGQVGGVPEILRIFMSLIVGTYAQFYSSISKIEKLYKLKS